MPRRKYPQELFERCKVLFVSGVSVRQIATQCGIPPCTVAARAQRENWNGQRLGLIEPKPVAFLYSFPLMVFKVVGECNEAKHTIKVTKTGALISAALTLGSDLHSETSQISGQIGR